MSFIRVGLAILSAFMLVWSLYVMRGGRRQQMSKWSRGWM